MKKFAKGMLIAAGSFFAVGVILGSIGAIGGHYSERESGYTEGYNVVWDTLNMLRKWDFRWRRGGERGLVVTYDGIVFDQDHDIVYGSFTDDSLRGTDIYKLDLEIGGGTLTLRTGDSMSLKKDGGPECQYYIEGDTFYLKQKCPVAGGLTDLTLTLPEGINLNEIDIEMGAGQVITRDFLSAEKVKIEIAAGEIIMESVETGYFDAEVSAGSVVVHKLDTKNCDIEVNMGSITLENSLVTGNMDADVNMGNIDIFLRDSYENHDYDVDCGMGDITISPEDGRTKEFAGFSSNMELSGRNASGESKYNLTCDMGNIVIGFKGVESSDDGGNTAEGNTGNDGDAAVNDAGGHSMKAGGTEKDIDTLEAELAETGEQLSAMEDISGLEDISGIENNWPESIGRENDNTTADNFSFQIWISEPMTLEVSCVTKGGELDLEIEDEKGKDIFEKDDIQTGTYEVKIKSAGNYTVSFEAENHTGSFWIRPKE